MSARLAGAIGMLALALAGGSPATAAVIDEAAAVGPGAVLGADGLYRLQLDDGYVVATHGPDPRPGHGTTMRPGDPERQPVCGTDGYQRILYGRPHGAADRSAEAIPQILASVRRMNAVLYEESIESGGIGADFKVFCDKTGAVRVETFTASDNSFGGIITAARRAGHRGRRHVGTDYTIFYDGSAAEGEVCGLGTLAWDDELAPDNASVTQTGYAVVYDGCWDGLAPLHEVGHTQGAVQQGAPFSTGDGGHCNEQIDVMCYADGGSGGLVTTLLLCPEKLHFDCRHDTYFDSAPEPGEWLATHWNLGHPFNTSIEFGR